MTPEHLTALRQAAAEAKACGPLGALRTAVHGVEQLADEVEQLTAERDEARAALRRVRDLHRTPAERDDPTHPLCSCGLLSPCPTRRAADG